MSKSALSALLSCLVLIGSDSPAQEVVQVTTAKVVSSGPNDWLLQHPTILRLVEKTNEHRARMGRGPVSLNEEMALAAQRHATFMGQTGAYQHSGLPYMEVIFTGPLTADDAVNGWINSPAHHNILLSGSEVGFGYVNQNGRTYWVGVFR